MKKIVIIAALLTALVLGNKPTTLELMKQMDKLFNQSVDITAQITILQQRVKQGKKVFKCVYYRRDSDDAFLVAMSAPESEKGNGYLRSGENFWMYRRNTRTFQHINRDESISGTDIRGGDMERVKLMEQFEPEKGPDGKPLPVEETTLGKNKIKTYTVTIVATADDVTYPRQTFWLDRKTYLPKKSQNYSLSGTLMTTTFYYKYTVVEGRYVCILSKFVDEFEKGNVSVMKMSGVSFNPIENDKFTKAYLENLSK